MITVKCNECSKNIELDINEDCECCSNYFLNCLGEMQQMITIKKHDDCGRIATKLYYPEGWLAKYNFDEDLMEGIYHFTDGENIQEMIDKSKRIINNLQLFI